MDVFYIKSENRKTKLVKMPRTGMPFAQICASDRSGKQSVQAEVRGVNTCGNVQGGIGQHPNTATQAKATCKEE